MERSLFRFPAMKKPRAGTPAFYVMHSAWILAVSALLGCASTCAWSKESLVLEGRQIHHLFVLVNQLGSEDFDEREAAQRKLIAYGPTARELLVSIRDTVEDFEIRQRLKRVVLEYDVLDPKTVEAARVVRLRALLKLPERLYSDEKEFFAEQRVLAEQMITLIKSLTPLPEEDRVLAEIYFDSIETMHEHLADWHLYPDIRSVYLTDMARFRLHAARYAGEHPEAEFTLTELLEKTNAANAMTPASLYLDEGWAPSE
jgi:hypothetical protein